MPEISVDFSNEQSNAFLYLNDKHTNRVLFGGQAGGGKSFLISMWQIRNRVMLPGTRGYIGREHLKNLKNSIAITLFDCLKYLRVPYKYNDQKSHIDFANGSRIVFLDVFDYPSDPDFEALGSTEYTDGAIEEGGNVSQRAVDLLITRTRYKHVEFDLIAKQLITCNPADTWIKHQIVVPHFEGTLKPGTVFIPATLASNPNKDFAQKYRETLETITDPYDKSRLLHGDWFTQPHTGGEFYKNFKRERNVDVCEYHKQAPIHATFDFNVQPYCTMNLFHYYEIQLDDGPVQKSVEQFDEITLMDPRNTTRDACTEFKRRYPNHDAGLFIYGDPSGKHEDTRTERGVNDFRIIENELEHYHPELRIDSKAPSVVQRGNFINSAFEDRIEGVEIIIGETCDKTIDDYLFVLQNSDGGKLKKKIKDKRSGISYEKYGHTSDANDYFIIRIFANEYHEYIRGTRPVEYRVGKRIVNQSY